MQALSIFVAWPDAAWWTHAAAATVPLLLVLAVMVSVALMIERGVAD